MCIYEKKFLEFIKRFNIKREDAELLFIKEDCLASPNEFLYKLVEEKLPKERNIKLIQEIIDFSLRSYCGKDIYDRSDFFLYIADRFAQKSKKNVFLIQFDIKSCFKLSKIISSEEIFKIHNFILDQTLKYFKRTYDFSYAFDATRNDDCFFIIGGRATEKKLENQLSKLQEILHNSIIRDIKSESLYIDKYIITYGFSKLGCHKSLTNLMIEIEQMHDRSKIITSSICPYTPETIYNYKDYYEYQNPYFDLNINEINKIYYLPDDYSSAYKERLLLEEIKQKSIDGYLINFKFQNASGVNKLLISKEYSIKILLHYIEILRNILDKKNLLYKIYFVGLNSFILYIDKSIKISNITKLFRKFENDLDLHINNRFINEYFDFKEGSIANNLKISDIPSKRGLNNGITTINYLCTHTKNIQNLRDLINFKKLALYTNQTNIKNKNIKLV